MSRHRDTYGTYEDHYYTQPNFDEGVGAFEFGAWHTQQREGLLTLQVQGGGSFVARIPPGETTRGKYPVDLVRAVEVKPTPQPRKPTGPLRNGPQPTPGGPKDTGGGRGKKTEKPKAKAKTAESGRSWQRLITGGFR